jgi:lipoyl-dependent peroxiredoxin
MNAAHAAEIPFSFASRFEGQAASNPEELIGAALAGCFSMALSLGLEKAGASPKTIRTSANVKLDKDGDGFTITAIELTTAVEASGLDDAKFQAIANATKKGCPVSKALAAVPEHHVESDSHSLLTRTLRESSSRTCRERPPGWSRPSHRKNTEG